eukprot:4391639-Pleurochrysis_carterae.AAC.1
MSGANEGSHVEIHVKISSTHARRLICEQSQNGCLDGKEEGSLVVVSIRLGGGCDTVDSVRSEALREPEVATS